MFCLCCKEICKEAKKHDFMNNETQRYIANRVYPKRIKGTFWGDAEELVGKCCLECFLDMKKFEFEWETEKLIAQMEYDSAYERSKEEKCCGCDRY